MAERRERRLTAIVATDVVGYTRLMAMDEEGTLTALQRLSAERLDLAVAEYRGRLVKTAGDGMLYEFASVVEAVGCFVRVQRELA